MICADTSFLLSLFGHDPNTHAAGEIHTASREPLAVHSFNDFEFANAVRALVFRGAISEAQAAMWLAGYEADKRDKTIITALVDASAVLLCAEEISAAHTPSIGSRAYDILLVAAAKQLGATEFWSFDGKQRALAAAAGLAVGP